MSMHRVCIMSNVRRPSCSSPSVFSRGKARYGKRFCGSRWIRRVLAGVLNGCISPLGLISGRTAGCLASPKAGGIRGFSFPRRVALYDLPLYFFAPRVLGGDFPGICGSGARLLELVPGGARREGVFEDFQVLFGSAWIGSIIFFYEKVNPRSRPVLEAPDFRSDRRRVRREIVGFTGERM